MAGGGTTSKQALTLTVKRLVASILALTLTIILTATLLGQPMQQAYAADTTTSTRENPNGPFYMSIKDLDGNLIADTKGNGTGNLDIETFKRGIITELYYPPVGSSAAIISFWLASSVGNWGTGPSASLYGIRSAYYTRDYVRVTFTNITNIKINTSYSVQSHYLYANGGQYHDDPWQTNLYFGVTPGDGTGLDENGLSTDIGPDLTSSLSNLSESWLPEGFTPSADTTRYININTNSGLPDTTFGVQQATALDSINSTTGTSNIANQFASGKLFTVKGAPTDELLNPVENPQINATDLVILGLPYLYVALFVVLATCLPAGLLIRFVMFKRGVKRKGSRHC